MSMTPSRPYMIRGLYDWIVDNGLTPHIVVDASLDGVMVPQQHINKDGQIILNMAPGAIKDLSLGNDSVSFNARFGGVPSQVDVPVYAVMGIYARENGRGMMFGEESIPEPPPPTKKDGNKSKKSGRASLRVVK